MAPQRLLAGSLLLRLSRRRSSLAAPERASATVVEVFTAANWTFVGYVVAVVVVHVLANQVPAPDSPQEMRPLPLSSYMNRASMSACGPGVDAVGAVIAAVGVALMEGPGASATTRTIYSIRAEWSASSAYIQNPLQA